MTGSRAKFLKVKQGLPREKSAGRKKRADQHPRHGDPSRPEPPRWIDRLAAWLTPGAPPTGVSISKPHFFCLLDEFFLRKADQRSDTCRDIFSEHQQQHDLVISWLCRGQDRTNCDTPAGQAQTWRRLQSRYLDPPPGNTPVTTPQEQEAQP